MKQLSLLRTTLATLLLVLPLALVPACRSTLATCMDFCDRAAECTTSKGCSCSLDRCDNEGDVADAVDACLEKSCDEYLTCVNQALATCELD